MPDSCGSGPSGPRIIPSPDAGLLGGGSGVPRPGEVSLAHHGVLFLDELPEFARNVLELLRQPLEERSVTLARSTMTLSFPASLILLRIPRSIPVREDIN